MPSLLPELFSAFLSCAEHLGTPASALTPVGFCLGSANRGHYQERGGERRGIREFLLLPPCLLPHLRYYWCLPMTAVLAKAANSSVSSPGLHCTTASPPGPSVLRELVMDSCWSKSLGFSASLLFALNLAFWSSSGSESGRGTFFQFKMSPVSLRCI